MTAISTQAIRELRERTQAGMSDCKSALTEAEGDMEKAVAIILKKGLAKSAKRASAVATEGEVRAALSADKRSGSIVEVNIQTDFAARSDGFQQFVADVLALAEKTPKGADLTAQPLAGKTVGEVATELTGKIGEKIAVRRWDRLEVAAGKQGLVTTNHLGGKIGVVLLLEADSAAAASHAETAKFAEETAMQIAAMNPLVMRRGEVSEDQIAKQKDIFTGQLREDPKPKPEASWPKIVEGKLTKWYSEICLLEQESVVTPGQTVDKLAEAASKAAGGAIQVAGFVRYERGEGIEKAATGDFAAEVAAMAAS